MAKSYCKCNTCNDHHCDDCTTCDICYAETQCIDDIPDIPSDELLEEND